MKQFLHNNKILRDRRRDLRKNQTVAEEILWQNIRNRKLDNLKFYRQYSVGPYILDFYCPKLKLAIELDGKSHGSATARDYDAERTQYLQDLEIDEIRFKNEEVINELERVLKQIHPLLS